MRGELTATETTPTRCPRPSIPTQGRRSPEKRALDRDLRASPSSVAVNVAFVRGGVEWCSPAERWPLGDDGDGPHEGHRRSCVRRRRQAARRPPTHASPFRALLRRERTAARDPRPRRSCGCSGGPRRDRRRTGDIRYGSKTQNRVQILGFIRFGKTSRVRVPVSKKIGDFFFLIAITCSPPSNCFCHG